MEITRILNTILHGFNTINKPLTDFMLNTGIGNSLLYFFFIMAIAGLMILHGNQSGRKDSIKIMEEELKMPFKDRLNKKTDEEMYAKIEKTKEEMKIPLFKRETITAYMAAFNIYMVVIVILRLLEMGIIEKIIHLIMRRM